MKVIQVIPRFSIGGAETMCESLSVFLKKAGCEVIVVSLYRYQSCITERLESEQVKVIYLDKKSGPDSSVILRLVKLFRSEKPDVVHTHLYAQRYAVPAAMLAGTKRIVHTVHNVAEKEAIKMAQKLGYFFYHYCHVTPVALSEEIQTSVCRLYRLPPQRVPVAVNGVDLRHCMVKNSYDSGEKLKFLHIGRFSEQKNHAMLLEAFGMLHADYPETELTLIGEGPLVQEIHQKAEALGLGECVHFAGVKDNVFPELHRADVFVLPSLYEGVPITLIEAMGTGLPIVATAVGGVPDMLTDGENALLTAVDAASVAKAMKQMTDVELRERLGKCARVRAVKQFSAEHMTEAYCAIYKQ